METGRRGPWLSLPGQRDLVHAHPSCGRRGDESYSGTAAWIEGFPVAMRWLRRLHVLLRLSVPILARDILFEDQSQQVHTPDRGSAKRHVRSDNRLAPNLEVHPMDHVERSQLAKGRAAGILAPSFRCHLRETKRFTTSARILSPSCRWTIATRPPMRGSRALRTAGGVSG